MGSFDDLLKEREQKYYRKNASSFDNLLAEREYRKEQKSLVDEINSTDIDEISSAMRSGSYLDSETRDRYKRRLGRYIDVVSQLDTQDEAAKAASIGSLKEFQKGFTSYSDMMAQFKDKDAYKRAVDTDKYKDYSYEGLQKVIAAKERRSTNDAETSKEVEWLRNYALEKDYDDVSDYDKAIEQATQRITALRDKKKENVEENSSYLRDTTSGGSYTSSYLRDTKDGQKASEKRQEIDDEIKKYEKVRDALSAGKNLKLREDEYKEWMSVSENEDFDEVSASRDIVNPTYEKSRENDRNATLVMYGADQFFDNEGNLRDISELDAYLAPREAERVIPDRLGLYMNSKDIARTFDSTSSYDKVLVEGDANRWDLLEPEEVEVYYYYLNKGEKDNADKFLDSMAIELGSRAENEFREHLEDPETTTLEKIAWNVASVPMTVYGGALGFMEDALTTITGGEINPYSAAHRGTNYASAIRGATAKDIQDSFDNDFFGSFFANTYQAGMSMADSILGSSTLGAGYTVTMGMGAATQKAKELYESGASTEDIAWGALASGVIEFVTEKLSYDFIVENVWNKAEGLSGWEKVRQIVKGALASATNEGVEEVNADLLNYATDAIIQGFNSASEKEIRKLVIEQGLTEDEARRQVAAGNAVDTLWSFYGGFISGGGHAVIGLGVNTAKSAVSDKINHIKAEGEIGSEIRGNQNVERLVAGAEALEDTKENSRVKKLARKVAETNTENLSDREYTAFEHKVGKLYTEVQNAQIRQYADANKAAIKEELEAKGVEDIEKAVDVVAKGYFDTLSASEKKLFDKVGGEDIIDKVVSSEEFRNKIETSTDTVAASAVRGIQNTASLVDKADAEVSDTGTTMRISTGEKVKIKEISSIKNGKMTFTLEDGTRVSSKDIQYANNDEAHLYESVKAMKFNAATANAIVNAYDPSSALSTRAYIAGMEEGYRYGEINMPLNSVATDTFFDDLTESQKALSYKLGQVDSAANVKAAQKAKNILKKGKTAREGNVVFDGDESSLSDRQRESLAMLENVVTSTTHNNVYIYESVEKDGKRVFSKDIAGYKAGEKAFNGIYDEGTGDIYIDLNAGDNGEGVIMWTAAHELTHFVHEWSPTKFKALADFLMAEYGKKGVNVQQLIRDKQYRARKHDRPISYDVAYEEVVADSMQLMFTDTNAAEKIAKIQNTDRDLWQVIKDGINKLLNRIKSLYEGLKPQTKEAEIVRGMKDSLEKLSDLFAEALVDAGNTYQQIGGINLQEYSAAKTTDGKNLFQYRAMEADEAKYREMLINNNILTEKQTNQLFKTIDMALEKVKNNLEALDYAWDVDIDDRAFGAVKPNSDTLYKVSVDFSTLCRKRILQQTIQNTLQNALNRELTREEGILIRDELLKVQEEGRQIEVACALCYVESARMKSNEQIQKFLDSRENVLKEFFAGKDAGSMREKIASAEKAKRHELAVRFSDSTLETATLKSIKSEFGNKVAQEIRDAKKAAKQAYVPTAEEQKLIDTANDMTISDFTTPKGLENLSKSYPRIFDAYTSFIRNATKSKGIENDTWWRAGDSQSIGDSLIEAMNRENGLRTQSWSDFQVIHLMDYIAATIELSTRNAKMQAYTKVPDYVHLMGNTNQMINLSLIPTADFNGTLRYDSTEGMDYKTALKLRDKYHSSVGTICIGMDDTQIRMLLADATIDYVIPYHKSGMSAATRRLMHIPAWNEYEKYQNETALDRSKAAENAKTKGVKLDEENLGKSPNFSDWFDVKEAQRKAELENDEPSDTKAQKKYGVMYGAYKAMQNAADNYKRICAERGLVPKFESFSNEENYWKLLIDRKMVDNVTGEVIEQKAVKPIFDQSEVMRILNDEVKRYPSIQADQEYATKKVISKFVSGELDSKLTEQTADAIKKNVDALSMYNIIESQNNDNRYSIRNTEKMSWEKQVSGYFAHNNTIKRSDSFVLNGFSDSIVSKNNLPNIIPVSVLTKAIKGKDASHSLRRDTIENFERDINNWYIAIEDKNKGTVSYVFDSDTEHYPVFASFTQSSTFDNDDGNIARSIHLRTNILATINALDYGCAVYIRKNESGTSSRSLLQAETLTTKAKLVLVDDTTSSPKSQEGKGNLYSDRDDVGYHAGNLGKSEYLNVQGRGRDTGHFGTGTYFVGTQEKVTEDSYYGKRPQHAVDFSKYNLFKVGTDKRGYKLHDALRVIDGGVNEDRIEAVSNKVWRIVNTTDWFDYAEETFGDDWYEYKNQVKAIKDTAKKYGLELPSDEDFMKAEGFTSPDEEDFYEYQAEYFRKAFNEAADKVNGEYERFRDAYDDLLNVFGYHTAKVNSAIRAVAEYQKTADKRAKVDSYATVFMKAMGYDGVDVRGTGLDNTGYGSVIYELKDNTVLYSDRGEASTDSRTLLSNALASAVTNDIEKAKLADYQAKIEQMNEAQNRLTELRAQIREISFGKGKRDMAKLSQLRDEATKLANRVNVYDKQLLRLEATKPLQKVLEREKAKAYKKAKAESKEALKSYKESAARKQQQIIDRYNERIARGKERRDMTLLRNKIKKISEDFKQRLLNGTDRRYVPSGLIEGVISVCEAIDPTGRDQSTKAAQRYRDGKAALLDLKNAYDNLQYEDYDFSSEFSEEFSSHISELADAIGNTPLRDMSYEQLQYVHDILSDIKFMLQQATKQIGVDEAITNYEAGQELIDVMRYVEEKGLTTGKVSSFFRNWTENPMRATREMSAFRDDSRLKKLFEQLNEGRRKMETFRMNAYKEFDKLRASKEDAKNFNDAVEKAFDFGLRDRYGKPLKITKMQAMQLVLTWEREQANKGRKHLESGAVIPDIDLQAKGKYKEAKRAGQHTGMITQETIDIIESKLSEWDKKYLDTARNFFNGMAKDAINETTMVTRHRPIATEASYIPYVVNKDYVKKESDNVKFDATIEGWGSLKSVKNNAPQELIMNGLNAVAADHIDSVGKVYGLSIPVRNFNKVFNMQQTIEDGGIAVKEAIGDAWGEAGLELIDKAVADVQTPRRHDTVPAVQFVKSAFVQSTLASNISVSIKQAASYPTAGAYLKGASLLKGLAKYATVKNQEAWDEIDEHTSQHWLRRIGLSTQELGEMNQTKGWQNKLNKKLGKASPMNWIQTIDVGTTAALWYACKAEVESKGIKQTDARYWDEVTKLYDTVIEETQPMYDSLHRAEITKRSGLNNIIMFQTQPIQNSGILREGAMEYKTAKKQYGAKSAEAKAAAKKFGMAVSSQAASHFVFTAMTLLAGALLHKMNPWRDKDKEVTPESVLEEFAKEFGENYFSAIVPIFGSLAVSAVEKLTGSSNYDVLSDSVVDKINTSIDKLSKPASALWDKVVNGEDSTKLEELTWENYVDVASEAASYFGIPLANAKNIIWGAVQNGIDAVNGEFGTFEYGTTRTKSQEIDRAYSAYVRGDSETAKTIIKDLLDEKISEGKTDNEAKQAVRTSCTNYFKPLFLAAYKDKDNEEMTRIRKAMAATGVYDDVPEATQKWIKDSQK